MCELCKYAMFQCFNVSMLENGFVLFRAIRGRAISSKI